MKVVLTIRGQQFECKVEEIAEKVKSSKLETTGLARNLARVKKAIKEGRSGVINSADGYKISYQL